MSGDYALRWWNYYWGALPGRAAESSFMSSGLMTAQAGPAPGTPPTTTDSTGTAGVGRTSKFHLAR